MKKLTLIETIILHKEMWNWLAKTGVDDKKAWSRWRKIEDEYGKIYDYCFACNYCADHHIDCIDCIFRWPYYDTCCTSYDKQNGLWEKWFFADNIEKRKNLAKQIADLPLKLKYQKQVRDEVMSLIRTNLIFDEDNGKENLK